MLSAGMFDLTINGSLVVGNGVDFVVRTGIFLAGNLTLSPGSTFEYDGPVGSSFYTRVTAGSSVLAAGNSGERITIKGSNPSTTTQGFLNYGTASSLVFQYVDFINLATAVSVSGAEPNVEVSNSTFQGCKATPFSQGPMTAAANLLFQSNSFTGTSSTTAAMFNAGPAVSPSASGQRVIDGCSFDKLVNFNSSGSNNSGANNFSITRSYFNTGISINGPGPWAAFDQNVYVQQPNQGPLISLGPITNSIFVTDAPSVADPNVITIRSISPPVNAVKGCIYQANCLYNNAAFTFAQNLNPTSPITTAMTGNIILPNMNAAWPGASASLFIFVTSNPNVQASVEHNTCVVDTGRAFVGMVFMGDGSSGASAGQLTSLRSNIAYAFKPSASSSSHNGFVLLDASVTNPVIDPKMVGYNGGFNLTASARSANTTALGYLSAGTGLFFKANQTPMAESTDVDEDPAFVDRTRDLSTAYTGFFKATTTGTAVGDWRASIAALAADPTRTQSLIDWIKAGWTPTNPDFLGGAHDGGNIGAAP